MTLQSTNHIMLMEPVAFAANPQTRPTNDYQADNPEDVTPIQAQAVQEFRAFRDKLVSKGIIITTALGHEGCPDDIFCNNWVSTHEGGKMILYPMLAENRRTERRPSLINMLGRSYDVLMDLTDLELQGQYLESTGSLAMDRVNKVIYCALSARTNKDLAQQVADKMGYKIHFFDTKNHAGNPVYHTDLMMYIGTGYIGVCAECIVESDRQRILDEIAKTHKIVELTLDQLHYCCGNALEVRGSNDELYLVMSKQAHEALRADQKAALLKHVKEIISSDLATIEKYGGGSARCMMLELH